MKRWCWHIWRDRPPTASWTAGCHVPACSLCREKWKAQAKARRRRGAR